jgi:hypothetical protein
MTITDADFAALKMDHARLKGQVSRLERQAQFLLDHLQLEYVDSQPETVVSYPDVVELKRKGKIIEAIQLYRLKTNAGLAEAKMFVDELEI